MKRNVSVVRLKLRCNILISGKIIKELPGLVGSGTPCISDVEIRIVPQTGRLVIGAAHWK